MKLTKLYQLAKYRAKAAAIEREWDSQKKILLALPKSYGYKSVGELIKALKIASGQGSSQPSRSTGKRRKARAIVTAKTKESVKKAVAAKQTANQIAHDLKLSPATVHNIKTELGLTKKRG